jgi:hypothetical protein
MACAKFPESQAPSYVARLYPIQILCELQTIGIVILSTGEEDDAISREGNLELRPLQVSGTCRMNHLIGIRKALQFATKNICEEGPTGGGLFR